MARGAQKGRPKPEGSGRKKGSLNKRTDDIKGMIIEALDKAGGAEYLYAQALENPATFLMLVGKILPRDVNSNVGGTIILNVDTGVPRN